MIPEESYSLSDINQYIQDLYRKISCFCMDDTFISSDASNSLTIGTDGKLFVPISGGSSNMANTDLVLNGNRSHNAGIYDWLLYGLQGGVSWNLYVENGYFEFNAISGNLYSYLSVQAGQVEHYVEDDTNSVHFMMNTSVVQLNSSVPIYIGDFIGGNLPPTETLTWVVGLDSVGKLIKSDAVDFVSLSGTQTLTNKRIQPRIGTTTSSTTPTINTDTVDEYHITAQAADITSFTSNLSGTPVNGQELVIVVKGTASRAITWGASFASSDEVPLPTTTSGTKALCVKFKIIGSVSTTVWQCMAVVNAGS